MAENPKAAFGTVKPMLDVIPESLALYASLAYRDGAIDKAYGVKNWRETNVLASTYIAALKRHTAEYADMQDMTDDSIVPTLAAIAACVGILIDATECGTLIDDRKPGPAGRIIQRFAAEQKDRARAWELKAGSNVTFAEALDIIRLNKELQCAQTSTTSTSSSSTKPTAPGSSPTAPRTRRASSSRSGSRKRLPSSSRTASRTSTS